MTQTTENAILTIENGVFHSKEGFVSGTPIFVDFWTTSRV